MRDLLAGKYIPFGSVNSYKNNKYSLKVVSVRKKKTSVSLLCQNPSLSIFAKTLLRQRTELAHFNVLTTVFTAWSEAVHEVHLNKVISSYLIVQ